MSYNCQGLGQALHLIEGTAAKLNLDVICLQETLQFHNKASIPGYRAYYLTAKPGRPRGLCTLVKNSKKHELIKIEHHHPVERITIKLETNGRPLHWCKFVQDFLIVFLISDWKSEIF